MPTRKQLNIRYELPTHTDLSDKYDFLYDYNTRKGYVSLKDSDDWREIENMTDEVRDALSKLPIINKKEGDEKIPLMYVNKWSEETKNKYRKYKEKQKYLDNRGSFTKLMGKVHQFILDYDPEKDKYIAVMSDPDNTIIKWYKKYNKKGGRLISRNPINRFKLK